MKDNYGKRQFECKCKAITEEFAWTSALAKTKVKCKCGKELGFKDLKKKIQAVSIRTDTKNR